MTTIVMFAWGPAIRNGVVYTEQYIRRIFAGFCKFSTLPWRMVLFTDKENADLAVPLGVEKRVFDMIEWRGCLPKLYAHSAEAGLTGIQLSQPHLNDLETIYANTVDRGIPLLSYPRAAAEAALAAGRDLRGRVHCG